MLYSTQYLFDYLVPKQIKQTVFHCEWRQHTTIHEWIMGFQD